MTERLGYSAVCALLKSAGCIFNQVSMLFCLVISQEVFPGLVAPARR